METLPNHIYFQIALFTDIRSFLPFFSSTCHSLRSFLIQNENILYKQFVFRDFPDYVTDVENLEYPHFWYAHYMSTFAKMKKRDELRRNSHAVLEAFKRVFDKSNQLIKEHEERNYNNSNNRDNNNNDNNF